MRTEGAQFNDVQSLIKLIVLYGYLVKIEIPHISKMEKTREGKALCTRRLLLMPKFHYKK